MGNIDVKYINPFLKASLEVIKKTCDISLQIGKPFIRNTTEIDDSVAIIIGMTGQIQGQVFIIMPIVEALQIASKMMMGMPVTELDDMAVSAISELGNMIMGNTATIFAENGIITDITPPSLIKGKITIKQSYGTAISIPIEDNIIHINLDIILKNN